MSDSRDKSRSRSRDKSRSASGKKSGKNTTNCLEPLVMALDVNESYALNQAGRKANGSKNWRQVESKVNSFKSSSQRHLSLRKHLCSEGSQFAPTPTHKAKISKRKFTGYRSKSLGGNNINMSRASTPSNRSLKSGKKFNK